MEILIESTHLLSVSLLCLETYVRMLNPRHSFYHNDSLQFGVASWSAFSEIFFCLFKGKQKTVENELKKQVTRICLFSKITETVLKPSAASQTENWTHYAMLSFNLCGDSSTYCVSVKTAMFFIRSLIKLFTPTNKLLIAQGDHKWFIVISLVKLNFPILFTARAPTPIWFDFMLWLLGTNFVQSGNRNLIILVCFLVSDCHSALFPCRQLQKLC